MLCPEKLITVIKATYSGAKYHMQHRGKNSEEFEIAIEVRQHCILSLIIFLLVVDNVLHTAMAGKRAKRGKNSRAIDR